MKNKTKIVSIVLFLSAFIMVISCGKQKTEWKGTIEEENGVIVVKNPKEPIYGEINFVLEEDLIIGKETDENYLFFRAVGIAIDDQNNIYALDYGNHRVQRYDMNGNFVHSFGKKGQGPGDLDRPSKHFLSNNGEFLVLDNRLIKVFNLEGKIQKTIQLRNRISDFYENSGGYIFSHYSFRDEENNVRKAIIKIDSDGKIIEKFDEFSEIKTSHSIKEGKMTYTFGMYNPFAPILCFCSYGSNGFCYAFSSKYEIYIRDNEGKLLYKIQKDEAPLSISGKEKNTFLKRAEERNKRIPKNIIRKAINFPPHKPYFNKILSDELQRIYVRKFGTITEPNDTKVYEFDIFSHDGNYLYKTRLPFLPRVIKNGLLYKVESNIDTGEIKIRRYKIKNWDQIKTGIN